MPNGEMVLSSREVIPFSYAVTIAAANFAAGASASATLVLGTDSEFELYGFEASTSADCAVDTAANARNVPNTQPDLFSVFIKDTTTGRDLMTTPLRRSQVCGATAYNFTREGLRIRFPRQEQFQFDFVNLTSGPGFAFGLTFILKGYKVFSRLPM